MTCIIVGLLGSFVVLYIGGVESQIAIARDRDLHVILHNFHFSKDCCTNSVSSGMCCSQAVH